MRLRWIKIIYAKEILETLRDRRTLFILIALPILLYPILFLLMGTVIESHIENIVKKRVTLEIWGEPPEGLLSSFNENKNEKFEVTTIPESPADTDVCLRAREKLLEKKIEAVMLIGSDITCEPQKEGPGYEIADHGPMGNFIVLYDGANDYSSSGATYVSNVLEKFTKNIVRQNLQQAGLDPDLEQPFFIKRSNLAGEQRMGGHYAGGILPMLLILMVVLGAFYPAIDLSAGEKERGTLETLITAPVHPAEIVAGKYLAVVTISLIASGMNLLSMGLTINRMADQFTDGKFVLSIGGAAMVLVMLVPTVFFFSALMLAIASLARDYKEAQTYLTPTYIIILLPAMIGGMPGIELNWATAFAPEIGRAHV